MRKFITAVAVCSALSGCADRADNVKATYVPPLQYQDYSCRQIRGEMVRVSQKVGEISGTQDSHASGDAVAVGVSLIFWPSLFFLASHDQHAELAGLKGQYDALQEVAIQKNCDVVKEINAAKKKDEARKAKKTEETKETGSQNNN